MAILIDTNVPIYVWGRDHPLKKPSVQIFEFVALYPAAFFTDAEVLQELLHRFRAIKAWDSARPHFQEFVELMRGRIEPMLEQDVQLAASLADRYKRLSARDLVHVAIATRVGATHIVSADTSFDAVSEIERLDPMRVDEWRKLVTAAR